MLALVEIDGLGCLMVIQEVQLSIVMRQVQSNCVHIVTMLVFLHMRLQERLKTVIVSICQWE